ncbi:MAG TPA: TraR/DksA C4-type zinc finger protein [Anaerolineales bacterium]|nr:TraR/DksA C4-type zinc finger protein [Anaerolineales bacterium]
MNAEQQAELRRELEALRAELEEQLAELGAELPGGRGVNPDRADLARTYDQMQRRTALEDRIENRLYDVRKALQRIEDGTYGTCENCGKPIDVERLEALPEANLCVECQSKAG